MSSLKSISECWVSLNAIKQTTFNIASLPEKVLQFGTGILLRGLPDFYVDTANKQGVFNGRILAVKSTSQGDSAAFDKQDNRYTVAVRGISNGAEVNKNFICSSISRVINANTNWRLVLEQARNTDLEIIISNTTEAGIVLVAESIHLSPPSSFPAKLTAFLYERYRVLGDTNDSKLLVIPTELVPDNGDRLSGYVAELAHLNKLSSKFLDWLEKHITFCNSLVDRIVPGLPAPDKKNAIEKVLGYTDDLLVITEPYSLWAIEGDDKVKKVLTFAEVDSSIIIVPDISLYRELKLRLLNATHTLACGFAVLSGIDNVKEAMHNKELSFFITELMREEISKTIDARISNAEVAIYINIVIDRFKNPYIQHQWTNISVEYSVKIKMRCIPLLLEYYKRFQKPPLLIAKGFAAWLLFMKAFKEVKGEYFGICRGKQYKIIDSKASYFYDLWKQKSADKLVEAVLKNISFWDADLSLLPGFTKIVQTHLNDFVNEKSNAVQ